MKTEALTLEKIEKTAISFNLAFGTSTIVSGPKTKSYKFAFICFSLASVILALSIFYRNSSLIEILLLSFIALAFFVAGVYLLAIKYDGEYRDFMLKKFGVIAYESKYSRAKLEAYKTLWLQSHFMIRQESFLEVVENLEKAVRLGKKFKDESTTLGEKILNYIFMGRLYGSFFTLGFLSIAMNAFYKFLDYSESLKMRTNPFINDLPAYTLAGAIMAIYAAILFGLIALAWRASRDLYLERRKGKCSKHSLNLFVQTLLKRATLPIYDARALARVADKVPEPHQGHQKQTAAQ